MVKIAMAVHGGAGPDSDLIKKNIDGYKKSLEEAVRAGYTILEGGGTSLDAVEKAVNYLEDNPLFNTGRGSVLNEAAEVQMEASIMNGKDLGCGAVALVQQVKNPVSLARAVMDKTKHIYLDGTGALAFGQQIGIDLRPDAYFITEYNYEQFEKEAQQKKEDLKEKASAQIKKKEHGTVGAVALDRQGNVAAATSTGGLENKKRGRIGDSSIIGVGAYANNETCAVSCTGDGEYMMQYVAAFHLSALMEYKGLSLKEASQYLIHEKCRDVAGDMGLIAVDAQGRVEFAFNSERMHRGWLSSDEALQVFIYPAEAS
jgi:beta-aspartyl-peptidase (threonine type)